MALTMHEKRWRRYAYCLDTDCFPDQVSTMYQGFVSDIVVHDVIGSWNAVVVRVRRDQLRVI